LAWQAYQCLLLARTGLVQAIYYREMLAELSRKLEDKFSFLVNRIQAVLYDWRRHAQEVRITGDLHVVTADPDDDKFIECAQTAGATVIVSGDRHLLNLGQYEGIVILSPAEFMARFNETSSIR
jgi:predicted nucleic acid-binding protein